MGCVSSCDQDGSRCAKGEVCLKFVLKVKIAREIRTDYFFSIHVVVSKVLRFIYILFFDRDIYI